ncbi:NitT/TauT family transport system substrate-binding protein [Propionispira arboris]|uniref:NitT/TauT family transport system substrate-binding protein n=1 Tax=Propionispira arboris TaxID=84035 RepID=A0A1H6WK68_9FIRM|nr:NitT/TauT family transport system substrate-binding protein [Propionispira arboris]
MVYLNTQARENYIDLLIEKGGFPSAAKETLLIPTYREAGLPAEKDVVDCIQWLNHKDLIKQSYTYQDIVTDILVQ